jgi:hypothetical protein
MSKLFCAFFVAAITAFSQDAPKPVPSPRPADILKIVEVQHADVAGLLRVLQPVSGGLVSMASDAGKKVIVLRGSPDGVAVIEDAIKRLDVPPPPSPAAKPALNVELTVYLLHGAMKEVQDAVPQDLAATTKQLHALFPYKSYRVLETFLLRSRDGEDSQVSGLLPASGDTYNFHFKPFVTPGPAPRQVRLNNLRLALRLRTAAITGADANNPNNFYYQDSGISTDLDAREGQKTVVGKSNLSGTDGDALILVVTPKVIE